MTESTRIYFLEKKAKMIFFIKTINLNQGKLTGFSFSQLTVVDSDPSIQTREILQLKGSPRTLAPAPGGHLCSGSTIGAP